jgi:hypothetical protein
MNKYASAIKQKSFNILSSKLNEISPLSGEIESEFLSAWKYWSVPKDHLLLRHGSISDYLYFIQKGIARIFYHEKDKQVTEWIAME